MVGARGVAPDGPIWSTDSLTPVDGMGLSLCAVGYTIRPSRNRTAGSPRSDPHGGPLTGLTLCGAVPLNYRAFQQREMHLQYEQAVQQLADAPSGTTPEKSCRLPVTYHLNLRDSDVMNQMRVQVTRCTIFGSDYTSRPLDSELIAAVSRTLRTNGTRQTPILRWLTL